MNNNLQRLAEPDARLYLFFMTVFAAVTVFFGMYWLALLEGAVIALLLIYAVVVRRKRQKQLVEYIESVTYDTENAKNNTLMNFPLPIAVFRLNDSLIVWGNEMFFDMCGERGTRLDAKVSDLVPGFNSKWLGSGRNKFPGLLEINGHKYEIHGNLIGSEATPGQENAAFMGITYWVDVTEFDNTRIEYASSRPVAGIVIIDNLDELIRNQPERIKNDIRDAIEDKLTQWIEECHGIIKRYERDRYLIVFEKRYLDDMKESKFRITNDVHEVSSPAGIQASLSIGLGIDGKDFSEILHFAALAAELAFSRGGDQTVIKNRLNFEFYGGRGNEVEKRTKVRSRMMAAAFAELMHDASSVLVMGHKYADLDSVGAAVGVCCLARKCGVKANIVIDLNNNASKRLIDMVMTDELYKDAFISPQEAMLRADGKTLLVVVDTNRPEQVEDADLLETCKKVVIIDHHRVAATYIQDHALSLVEPYASSACELLSEVAQEIISDLKEIRKVEADAMLAGIVLDTKNFTIRTGERTFEAAAYLRRAGADTVQVKKILKTDMDDAVARYKIMQGAEQYRRIAIAAPEEPHSRIVAAQAADELLNISGVEASIVIAANEDGGAFASARSIGDINVQLIMESLGGGGNRSAAAAQFKDCDVKTARQRVLAAIDAYLS